MSDLNYNTSLTFPSPFGAFLVIKIQKVVLINFKNSLKERKALDELPAGPGRSAPYRGDFMLESWQNTKYD